MPPVRGVSSVGWFLMVSGCKFNDLWTVCKADAGFFSLYGLRAGGMWLVPGGYGEGYESID